MARHKIYDTRLVKVGGLEVQVSRKNVKNMNLRVFPAKSEIRASVPRRASDRDIEHFLLSKLPWLKKHLSNYQRTPSLPKLRYADGDIIPVWGTERKLWLNPGGKRAKVRLIGDHQLQLNVPEGTTIAKKAKILKEWYRAELKRSIPGLIEKWEPIMNVQVREFGVKQMKTRWGTCNIRDRRIWLNLELAKKRPALLEYVVVHEMVHLLERLHSKRFYALMTEFLPQWKNLQAELNGRAPHKDC